MERRTITVAEPKLVACTLASGDLNHNPLVESGADRIGALAAAPLLGSLLWRYKWANDQAAGIRAKEVLKAVMLGTKSDAVVERICEIVVDEWVFDKCVACYGRGYSIMDGTPIARAACRVCNGSRVWRHSDAQRRLQLGPYRKLYAKVEHHFGRAHAKIAATDWAAMRAVKRELERGMERRSH
jgi:hypothetical protein